VSGASQGSQGGPRSPGPTMGLGRDPSVRGPGGDPGVWVSLRVQDLGEDPRVMCPRGTQVSRTYHGSRRGPKCQGSRRDPGGTQEGPRDTVPGGTWESRSYQGSRGDPGVWILPRVQERTQVLGVQGGPRSPGPTKGPGEDPSVGGPGETQASGSFQGSRRGPKCWGSRGDQGVQVGPRVQKQTQGLGVREGTQVLGVQEGNQASKSRRGPRHRGPPHLHPRTQKSRGCPLMSPHSPSRPPLWCPSPPSV